MARVIQPPKEFDIRWDTSVFLGGSIEMGAAIDWQKTIISSFKDVDDVVFLNPRRDDWDPSWEQSIHHKEFNKQVTWELAAQEDADFIVFYFDPNTKSPITLLELGLFCNTAGYDIGCSRMIVCCPEGYWQKGNVDIVCNRYNIEQTETLEELITILKKWVS